MFAVFDYKSVWSRYFSRTQGRHPRIPCQSHPFAPFQRYDINQTIIVDFCLIMQWTRVQITFTREINRALFATTPEQWENTCDKLLQLVTHC